MKNHIFRIKIKKMINDGVNDSKNVQNIQIPPPSPSHNNRAPQRYMVIPKGQLKRHTR